MFLNISSCFRFYTSIEAPAEEDSASSSEDADANEDAAGDANDEDKEEAAPEPETTTKQQPRGLGLLGQRRPLRKPGTLL